jgi:hypothetical protein
MSTEPAGAGLEAPDPPGAQAAAEQLWARVAALSPPEHAERTAEAVLRELQTGLRRWIGAEGYVALLARATARTLPRVAALGGVAGLAAPDAPKIGAPFSEDEIRTAVVMLLITMMRQLGDIIGPDMAVRMIDSIVKPSPRGVAGTETNEPSS